AFLERAGYAPAVLDLSLEPFDAEKVTRARIVAISVPMHTALRLGVIAAQRIRALNPRAHICVYGHYAALNAAELLPTCADSVLAGEMEDQLTTLVRRLEGSSNEPDRPTEAVGVVEPVEARRAHDDEPKLSTGARSQGPGRQPEAAGVGEPGLARRANAVLSERASPGSPTPAAGFARTELVKLTFPVPARHALPSLKKYAHLERQGRRELVAYVEASRGCKHLCRHCPIPPVYGGRFFVVPVETVLADVRQQVA